MCAAAVVGKVRTPEGCCCYVQQSNAGRFVQSSTSWFNVHTYACAQPINGRFIDKHWQRLRVLIRAFIHSFFLSFTGSITDNCLEQSWERPVRRELLLQLVRSVVKATDESALPCSDSENESVVDSDEAEEEGSDDELEDEEEEGKDWDELEKEAMRYITTDC